MIANALLVGLGGALGAIARYLVGLAVGAHLFPYATLIINIAGAVAIGALWGAANGSDWFESWGRLLLVTGVLGGFTTFSAFSLETLQLLNDGRVALAGSYIVASVVACVLGCLLGYRWMA